MGFLKKKNHNIQENEQTVTSEATPLSEPDDFSQPEPEAISRDEFHKLAEENLQDALSEEITEPMQSSDADTVDGENEVVAEQTDVPDEDDTIAEETEHTAIEDNTVPEETDADNAEPETEFEDNDMDDFSVDSKDNSDDSANDEPEETVSEEKLPRMTFKEFCHKHYVAIRNTAIALTVLFAFCIGAYIYGCCTITPYDVMGRNIYIEDINVSGLTYDEALIKVKNTSLLKNRDITLHSYGKSFTIDGVEAGLTARVEDTVDKAMRYGKTKNVLIDGLANTMQFFFRKTIVPSADVDAKVIRAKLSEFGTLIHGELVEHKLEVGDDKIICTPGHSGFSGETDDAYEQIREAINKERFSGIRVTLTSTSPSKLTVEALDAFAYANPQNARFEIKDNAIVVVDEVWGRYLDLDEAKPLIAMLREGGEPVSIPYYKSEPEIKAQTLNEKLFNGTIASYSTSYGGSTANRSANVACAAAKINEKVLMPGEVFSFNETVGPRSKANGFFPAPEYANGETIMGIGGGTCQVTTTLYNAVLYADLSIVSKLNHMFPVGYAPIGQDATVSDSGVDFKFMNNMEYPIKITAVTGGGKITISIVGTLRDEPLTVKMENITRAVGADKSVRTYRYVYNSKGELVRKDDLGSSYYIAHKPKQTVAPVQPSTQPQAQPQPESQPQSQPQAQPQTQPQTQPQPEPIPEIVTQDGN